MLGDTSRAAPLPEPIIGEGHKLSSVVWVTVTYYHYLDGRILCNPRQMAFAVQCQHLAILARPRPTGKRPIRPKDAPIDWSQAVQLTDIRNLLGRS